MAQRKIIFCAVTAALLSGCVGNAQIARSDFKYLQEKSYPPLQFPANLDKPELNRDFDIPVVKEADKMALGVQLLITPPAQVLTLVDGSIRPQDGERASIEFDVTAKAGTNPAQQIWASIASYLNKKEIKTQTKSAQDGVWVTDWFVAESEEPSSLLWGLGDYFFEQAPAMSIRTRLAFHVALSPSGRTAILSVTMPEFERYLDNQLERNTPTDIERDNLTVRFLNEAVMQYQLDVNSQRKDKSREEQRTMELTLKTDDQGETSIVVNAPFEQVWPHMDLVLKNAGFEVEDRDKVQATYFVTSPGGGIAGFFGFGGDELDLDSGDYKLLFGDKGETTTLTVFDEENIPVSKEDVEAVYKALKQAIVRNNEEQKAGSKRH